MAYLLLQSVFVDSLLQMSGYCFAHYLKLHVKYSVISALSNVCVQHFKQHKALLFKQCLKTHTDPSGAGPKEEGVSNF